MLKQVLVFTDLDGTLLDHHDYSFAPAIGMLKQLKAKQIPVIPNTSKTYAELKQIRQDIGLSGPFIVENGAAVYIPQDYFAQQPPKTISRNGFWVKEFSESRQAWLTKLATLKQAFPGEFEHFAQMTIKQIGAATGLTPEQSQLANSREYGEPVLWLGNESSKRAFIEALKKLGASPLQGGRFLHVLGDCNKGQALLWLQQQYTLQTDRTNPISIALGDGQNDIAMLEAAHIAVRILSPVNAPPVLNKKTQVYTSKKHGPKGWSACLQEIIFNPNTSPEVLN